MRGFYVLDANGCIKAKPSGTGAALTDPLPTIHGGTGQTTAPQGAILAAQLADSTNWIYKDTDNGAAPYKVLYNGGWVSSAGSIAADNGPRWGAGILTGGSRAALMDRPGSLLANHGRIAASPMLPGGFGSLTNNGAVTALSATGGTTSVVTDTVSTWSRVDTGTSTNDDTGWSQASGFRAVHRPFVQVRVRFGSVVGALRFAFAVEGGSMADPGNSDDFVVSPSTGGIVGMEYSTVLGQTGFCPFSNESASNSQIDGTLIAAIVASTTYLLSIFVDDWTTTLTVDDGTTVSSGTIATPAALAASSTLLDLYLTIRSTDGASKKLDLSGVYWLGKMRTGL